LRILFITYRDFMNPAAVGGEFYLWELARGLSRRGHKITLLCSSFEGSKPTEVKDGVELVRVDGSWNLPLKIFAEYSKRAQGNFDVVVEEVIGGQRFPYISALYVKEPLIGVWHQRHEKIFFEQYPPVIAAFLSIFERFLASIYRNHIILTPSEGAKEKLLPLGFKKSQIQVVYDGVGATFDKVEISNIRENTIVCLGKMRRYKRIDHAILAFKQVIAKVDKPCKLVIAGKVSEIDKGYLDWLQKLALDLGISKNVEFAINISEAQKLELLSHAKILVQPSPIEGFSIVVAEANRCGTPVVASDGVPHDVLRDGYNGFSYRFGELGALSDRIACLLNDDALWQNMSNNSVEWSKQFTWKRSALELEEILNKVNQENNKTFSLPRSGKET
jgi:glycosyltransferase involved in cell wall biosynthesis